ncbi:MAG: hypothetical protein M3R17_11885 [Bacteroidota bacterium]|nr:hypothetical protein [Bacteroidota bacterium]
MKTFIPFHQLNNREAIIVDGAHTSGLILSHWKGQNTIEGIADDTSAGVVINAIIHNLAGLHHQLITATHFDIDGLVGVWSLFEPGLALQHEKVLKAVARIGDFRELDLSRDEDDAGLKMVCWIDAEERNRFYPPFGDDHELKACAEKFAWFLPRFAAVVKDPDQFKEVWEKDYLRIKKDYETIHGNVSLLSSVKETGLTIIKTPHPVSYYALFSATHGSDIVLSMYSENRYELEYKYTTWVDIVSRPTLPRISLQPLCDKLNAMEQSGKNWFCDTINDTGPLLRIENSALTKAERFAHPTEREIFSSSIDAAVFEQEVVGFFREAYKDIQPKKNWSWPEIRSLNGTPITRI